MRKGGGASHLASEALRSVAGEEKGTPRGTEARRPLSTTASLSSGIQEVPRSTKSLRNKVRRIPEGHSIPKERGLGSGKLGCR